MHYTILQTPGPANVVPDTAVGKFMLRSYSRCLCLILLGMAVQPRFFCQFLCPHGSGVCPAAVLHLRGCTGRVDGCIPGCNAC